jgi:putative transposase
MPNYRRMWVPGGTYFFTVNLKDRKRRLLVEHVDALRASFRAARGARPFDMLAVVILPDHLHCIWRLPEGDADNADRWARIKSGFSRRLSVCECRSASRLSHRERGIWQRRYWEHLIRDEDDLRRHVDYIHINPMKHGHAACTAEWPHSSFRRWVERGAYPQDWAMEPWGGTAACSAATCTFGAASRYPPRIRGIQVVPMRATVAGLITPHILMIADLAAQAEAGANVDWHVKDAVGKTVRELALQYNGRDLLAAYTHWLESAAREAVPAREAYARVLQAAATAARQLQDRD